MEFKDIADRAWGEAIKAAVEEVIAHHAGYGINTDIQKAVKKAAEKIIDDDPELQTMIRDALKSWISTQTAEDFRRERDEIRRRYGSDGQ